MGTLEISNLRLSNNVHEVRKLLDLSKNVDTFKLLNSSFETEVVSPGTTFLTIDSAKTVVLENLRIDGVSYVSSNGLPSYFIETKRTRLRSLVISNITYSNSQLSFISLSGLSTTDRDSIEIRDVTLDTIVTERDSTLLLFSDFSMNSTYDVTVTNLRVSNT